MVVYLKHFPLLIYLFQTTSLKYSLMEVWTWEAWIWEVWGECLEVRQQTNKYKGCCLSIRGTLFSKWHILIFLLLSLQAWTWLQWWRKFTWTLYLYSIFPKALADPCFLPSIIICSGMGGGAGGGMGVSTNWSKTLYCVHQNCLLCFSNLINLCTILYLS